MTAFDIFCSNTTISMQLVRQYTNCISDYFFHTHPYQQLVPPCTIRKLDFFIMHHHLLTDHNVMYYPHVPPLLPYIWQHSRNEAHFTAKLSNLKKLSLSTFKRNMYVKFTRELISAIKNAKKKFHSSLFWILFVVNNIF